MSSNDPVTNPGGDGEVVNVTEARAGFQDKPMLWVLGIGIVLVFVALFGAWALFSGPFANVERHNAGQASDAEAFDAPLGAPKQNNIGSSTPRTGEPAESGVGTGPDDPRSTQATTGRGVGEGDPSRGSPTLP